MVVGRRGSGKLRQALLGGRGLGVGAPRDAPGAAGGVARPRRPCAAPVAIAAGSSAPKIELAAITAEQPSSIARAASEAVPTPASRITGTPARSAMIARL